MRKHQLNHRSPLVRWGDPDPSTSEARPVRILMRMDGVQRHGSQGTRGLMEWHFRCHDLSARTCGAREGLLRITRKPNLILNPCADARARWQGRGSGIRRGTWNMTIEGPAGGPQLTGKYRRLEKQRDGSWKVNADIGNSDLPPVDPQERRPRWSSAPSAATA